MGDCNYSLEYKDIMIISDFCENLIKRNKENQQQILETFLSSSWDKLSSTKKRLHTLNDCKGYWKDKKLKNALGLFPVKNITYKIKVE